MGTVSFLPFAPHSSETAVLWDTLGVDPEKIFSVRPLSEPDERGEILFLCVTGICGLLLSGGEGHPRQSAELGGVSLIFVKAREEFDSARPALEEPELELRFVISLPFDAEYFSSLEQ